MRNLINIDSFFANIANLGSTTINLSKSIANDKIEVTLTLQNAETGEFMQDLILIRDGTNETVEVLIWSDSQNENYTHSFTINKYVEPAE